MSKLSIPGSFVPVTVTEAVERWMAKTYWCSTSHRTDPLRSTALIRRRSSCSNTSFPFHEAVKRGSARKSYCSSCVGDDGIAADWRSTDLYLSREQRLQNQTYL